MTNLEPNVKAEQVLELRKPEAKALEVHETIALILLRHALTSLSKYQCVKPAN